ncbi:MAG TPA: PQQ-binding-like beta-propeller repeat protein [Streptosporangiaceae bacterium]
MTPLVKRAAAASGILMISASLVAGGYAGNDSDLPARGWTLPGADLQNTRDVAGPINSSNVSRLGVAWTVPITAPALPGGYATTPVVVNGVVYLQDLDSNVMAIQLTTGKVLWKHVYNSPNAGPDGVNVVNGTVYTVTASAAVALDAATGTQLWSRTLISNATEGIDMAPGYNHGTVYVSTVPSNVTNPNPPGDAGVLWALNARTGAPEWSWNETGDGLWGNPAVNSGGGLWYPPSFDSQGNLYVGVANPAPPGGAPGYPWGTSRPGPNLYTDSVVKLSRHGKVLWYYQLTPHDLYDHDLQNSPVLTFAGGRPVVIDGGKGGIMIELDARTGKLLWSRPVGVHNGHDNDGLLTEFLSPASPMPLPATVTVEPGDVGGMETALGSNGSDAFAAVTDLSTTYGSESGPDDSNIGARLAAATGEMVAVNQETGKITWDDHLPSVPFGGASITNDVVFTTTFNGYLYAFDTATGAILLKTPLSAGSDAPVAIDHGYVIVGAAVVLSKTQQPLIIAYKLGAKGTLPGTVNS